jgi:hypothetical protein
MWALEATDEIGSGRGGDWRGTGISGKVRIIHCVWTM